MKYILSYLFLISVAHAQRITIPPSSDTTFIDYVVTTKPVASAIFLLPKSDSIAINSKSDIIIENKRISNARGASITITNSSNIIIRNCFFDGAGAEAIFMYNCKNVLIEKCLFARVTTGVYASTSQGIKVIGNQFVNVRMRTNEIARGQYVQLNTCSGAGNEISGNKGECFQGESNPADLINTFKSSGTAASPMLIKNNMFRGGGPLASGGGIVAGDYGGSYITIDGNTLMNPGQYGIAIAGGNYNIVTNNKIFSKQWPWSNIALFIWAQAGAACSNNTIKSNRATWTNRDGISNTWWNAGNCTNTIGERPTAITEAEMGMPAHLIDFITPTELLTIRK